VIVRVTQEDIDEGTKGDCTFCPIALAVDRALGGECCVAVTIFDVYITENAHAEVFPLPSEARQFIQRFDKGKPVSPFEFELDLDAEGIT
jgi:hypothetical protein